LSYLAHDGTLYVGGYYMPVFKRAASDVLVDVSTCIGPPDSYELLPNYPNPFNPETKIPYRVGKEATTAGIVRVAVYDLLGREVAVLVNERKAPGSYEVTFHADGLASGLYVSRLTAGGLVQTQKMFLVR
jgi:hypothetical protein